MERTDFELYQLLEDNGYEATRENLEILKESIETGNVIIAQDVPAGGAGQNPEIHNPEIDNDDLNDYNNTEVGGEVEQVMVEDYTDFDFYQVLEENGYETTRENLEILKEAVETGEVIIAQDVPAGGAGQKADIRRFEYDNDDINDYFENKSTEEVKEVIVEQLNNMSLEELEDCYNEICR